VTMDIESTLFVRAPVSRFGVAPLTSMYWFSETRKKEGEDWVCRTTFAEVALPLDWPVYVSHAEASAYARWAGKQLPTEAQWHRAAYGCADGSERNYPWGNSAPGSSFGNFDFSRWDPTPVNAFPGGQSAFGLCDMLGNVAELATSNIFMAKDGVVFTPLPNGTFLAGITRQRVIGLLRNRGVTVIEKTLAYREFEKADEIFSTGNYSKVVPVARIGDRSLPFGPLYTRARQLYWEFAHS